jgi:hypothetical protein
MTQNAYIRLVEGSAVSEIQLEDVKQHLLQYKEQTSLTGQQLDWDYAEAAFPYTVEAKPEAEGKWFYLKGKNRQYEHIVFGIASEMGHEQARHYIQVILPKESTHGDKAKANEFCKYLGRKLKAEVELFNGRKMYYNPRK